MKIVQPREIAYGWRDLALVFHKLNEPDSAMLYAKKAYEEFKSTGEGNISSVLGDAYAGKGDYDSALLFYRIGVTVALRHNKQLELVDNYNDIADVFRIKNDPDSATMVLQKGIVRKSRKELSAWFAENCKYACRYLWHSNRPDSALKYLK
jgi:tetratricopeptide (TPR) repeat protein